MPDFTIELLSDKPVILHTHYHNDPKQADVQAEEQLRTLLEGLDHPVFCVLDITNLKVEFSDMVQALSFVTRGKSSAGGAGIYKHHNVRELIVVCNSQLAEFGVKALGQLQYGVKASTVRSVEEALNYVAKQAAVKNETVQKAG